MYVYTNSNAEVCICISESKFANLCLCIVNTHIKIVSLYTFSNHFGFSNSIIKIIKFAKSKFLSSEQLRFLRFQRILNARQEKQKYANYKALFLARTPVQTGV